MADNIARGIPKDVKDNLNFTFNGPLLSDLTTTADGVGKGEYRLSQEQIQVIEYQLGRIYYFGNGVRADKEKGLEYLKEAASHGNEYAANLLLTIQQQHTWGVASCTVSLFSQLGRIFQEQDQKQNQRQRPRMDRKHRREIEEKKQAMGIRD